MAAGDISIASNLGTQQESLTAQSVKCILASRAFIQNLPGDGGTAMATAKALPKIGETAPYTYTASEVLTTYGWKDLGAVMKSKVAMTYNKDYAEVRSGLDGIFRAAYVTSKTCEWSFALDNYDTTVLSLLTQTGAQVPTSMIGASVGYKFWIGREDIVTKQMLILGTNKIDGKEHQYYAPSALLKFAWEDDGDAVVVRVTATLRATAIESGYTDFYQHVIWD